jgi:membrane protease YdiL (CAAX protease family)
MITNAYRRLMEMSNKEHLVRWESSRTYFYYMGLAFGSLLIIFGGILGEWRAILALYNKSASPSTGSDVLLWLLVLLIAVIAGPVLRHITAFLTARNQVAENESQSPSHDSGTSE